MNLEHADTDLEDLKTERGCLKEEPQIVLDDFVILNHVDHSNEVCLLYTSPSPRDLSTSRMPSSA